VRCVCCACLCDLWCETQCETLVQEYDAELHSSIREWPREKQDDGTFVTPGFDGKLVQLCSKEIKACKKPKKTKKKKGKDDL
jgi:hypothetical protein